MFFTIVFIIGFSPDFCMVRDVVRQTDRFKTWCKKYFLKNNFIKKKVIQDRIKEGYEEKKSRKYENMLIYPLH